MGFDNNGAPASQANSSAQGEQGENGGAPKYITEEQFNTLMNRAMSARFNDFQKKLDSSIGSVLKPVVEQLSALQQTQQAVAQPNAQPEPSNQAQPKIEDHPLFRGLKKQVDELTGALAQSAQEKAAERNKARDVTLRQLAAEALTKGGIDPARTKHALALLIDGEKRISYDGDTDEVVFKGSDGQAVDLATGVSQWTKSPDAQIYIPPRRTQGSGQTPGNRTQGANGPSLGERLMGLLE